MDNREFELPRLIGYCQEILSRVDIEIFMEDTNVKGYCIFKEQKRLYMDNKMSEIEKFIAYIEILSLFDLENIYINPVIRRYLDMHMNDGKLLSEELYSRSLPVKKYRKSMFPKAVKIKRDNNEKK